MQTDITDSKKVMAINAAATWICQGLYRPENFPKRLEAFGVSDPKTLEKFVCKETTNGAQDFYTNLITKSLKTKDFDILCYWINNISVKKFSS
jgi:hypothetical protein